MKKKITTISIVILSILILLGCTKKPSNGTDPNEDPVDTYYALVLPEGITSNQPDNTKIKKDTEVTLTILIPNNHEIKDLMIYGINLADDVRDGKITFKMTGNLTVLFETREIQEEVVYYDYEVDMPSLWALPQASEEEIAVVEDAPDLLIFGMVLDTYKYFNYETMSAFEYVKVFNNTNQPYNLKNHRIVLANPMMGQNYEDADSKLGNASLVTGHLFSSFIDTDTFIEPLKTALIWLKPYYYTAGSGTDGYTKQFSSNLLQPEAYDQTIEDFRAFWHLDETTQVIKANNQPFIAKHPLYLDVGFYPIISPGAGQPYSHINRVLLRSLEIQKFDDQEGSASVQLLNNTASIPKAILDDPDLLRDWAEQHKLYDKVAFNVMEVKDNDEVMDMYAEFSNSRKYFKPVIRANFSGLIDVNKLEPGHEDGSLKVDFLSTSNPGLRDWPNTHEIQFRPPKVGERIAQLQVPVRDYGRLEKYMKFDQFETMRFVKEQVITYTWRKVMVKLIENPDDYPEGEFKWRLWEVESEGRLSGAAPKEIKAINLLRP